MARLPAVLNLLATLDGRSLASMQAVAEKLREAGSLPETKVGRGASHLAPEHAAALLLAILTTDSPAGGPEGVRIYSTLTPRHVPERERISGLLREAVRLPLYEALAAILEHSAAIRRQIPDVALTLVVKRPVPISQFFLRGAGGEQVLVAQWLPNNGKLMQGFYKADQTNGQDKVTAVSVTEATLFALSTLVMDEPVGETS